MKKATLILRQGFFIDVQSDGDVLPTDGTSGPLFRNSPDNNECLTWHIPVPWCKIKFPEQGAN